MPAQLRQFGDTAPAAAPPRRLLQELCAARPRERPRRSARTVRAGPRHRASSRRGIRVERRGYPGTVIIGIDTSLGTAVAAIARDGEIAADEQSANPLGHAEVIGDLLARAVAAAPEPTHVAIGMGPGPFTGLRVGIATARAFALGRGIPVVPVPSHDGVALGVLLADALTGTETPRFAVVTDARRREFAYSVYDGIDDDGLPIRVGDATLSPRDELDARLAEAGAARYDATSVSAAMIALAAARALDAGRELAGPEPLYLRSPDVVAAHAPKRVSA